MGEDLDLEGIPLKNNIQIAEYYYVYALALSNTNKCGEALQISQQIIGTIPSNDVAVSFANDAISNCQENLDAPPTATEEFTPTPVEGKEEEEETPTPEA